MTKQLRALFQASDATRYIAPPGIPMMRAFMRFQDSMAAYVDFFNRFKEQSKGASDEHEPCFMLKITTHQSAIRHRPTSSDRAWNARGFSHATHGISHDAARSGFRAQTPADARGAQQRDQGGAGVRTRRRLQLPAGRA
jgi:hypothetical protein